jgi:hypothetical protein
MKKIFKDDPQAIEKLKDRIFHIEKVIKNMKDTNDNYKKYGMEWALKNVSADILRSYANDMGYSWNKHKIYPGYMLSNARSNLSSAKKRLSILNRNN